jgi:hypothetical protein
MYLGIFIAATMAFPLSVKLVFTACLAYAVCHEHLAYHEAFVTGELLLPVAFTGLDSAFPWLEFQGDFVPKLEFLRGQMSGALVVALVVFIYVFAEGAREPPVWAPPTPVARTPAKSPPAAAAKPAKLRAKKTTSRDPRTSKSPSPSPQVRFATRADMARVWHPIKQPGLARPCSTPLPIACGSACGRGSNSECALSAEGPLAVAGAKGIAPALG